MFLPINKSGKIIRQVYRQATYALFTCLLYTKAMSFLLSIIRLIKKNLTKSNIKKAFIYLYKKLRGSIFAVGRISKRIWGKMHTREFKILAKNLLEGLLQAGVLGWGTFTTWFTVRYAIAGISILIEGYSGTMNNVAFETGWLILSLEIGTAIFVAYLIWVFYKSIRNYIKGSSEDNEFVTVATFNRELTNINTRLDNIERSLSVLIEGASHAETTEATKTKTTKPKANKKEKTSEA